MTNNAQPEKGTVLHALQTIGVGGRLISRGQTFTVDDQLLKNDLDRNGESALARMIERGRLGFGEFEATGLDPWEGSGDPVWSRLYVAAREKARAVPDPDERAKAEAAVKERFGPAPAGWVDPSKGQAKSKWAY